MALQTVKLSRKDRLEIKRKMLLLKKIPFKIFQKSLSSKMQVFKGRLVGGSLIPFPNWVPLRTISELSNYDGGFSVNDFVSMRINIMDPGWYQTNYFIPHAGKNIILNEEEGECGKTGTRDLIISGYRNSIIMEMGIHVSNSVYSFRSYEKIRLRYNPISNRLYVKTTMSSQTYDEKCIMNMVRNLIFDFINY